MRINKILIKPIVTEKTTGLYNSEGVYTMGVAISASKNQIKQALKDAFDVDAYNIRTVTMPGKRKRVGKTWRFNTTKMTKKAFFKLKKGKLDFYAGGD